MAIPENIINAVQDKVDIVEVVSRYIPLKKAGRNYKANCPFHHEKTPSFMVSQDKQIYHCFGCGAGGNVFSFLMKYESLTFPEALEMLAEKAGIVIPHSRAENKELASLTQQLYRANEMAAAYFHANLAGNEQAREYVRSRGINDETVKRFKIGYAPDSWEGLLNHLKRQGLSAEMAEKAGLVIANDRGGHYDRFRKRIIFPIFDLKEKILGFGGRVLDASLPKYMNSPETPIYTKGKAFYGLNFSKEHIRKEGYSVVVEGYLDFVVPFQAGIRNLVATLGTALTVDQIRLLKRFSQTVIVLYDPDEAGEAASLRNIDLFISEDMNVYVGELPQGLDPDTCVQKHGTEEFLRLVKSSKNLFDYKLDKLMARFNVKSANGKVAIAGEMLPTISKINNAVLKSTLITKLAERLEVDEESLKTELKKVKPAFLARQAAPSVAEPKGRTTSAEEMIIALLLEGGEAIDKVRTELPLDEFRDVVARGIVKAIFDLHMDGKGVSPAKLISHLGNSEEAALVISDAVNISETLLDKGKALEDCIAKIKKDNIHTKLRELQLLIKSAHDAHDEERWKELVREFEALRKTGKA